MTATDRSRRLRRMLPIALAGAVLGTGALLAAPLVPPGSLAPGAATPAASPAAAASPTAGPWVASPPSPTATPDPSATPSPPAPAARERASATGPRRAALQAQLDRLRERAGLPGISVAIIFDDGTTWLGQSGLADIDAGEAVTRDTAFAIASVTKTFTAALTLSLVDDGLLGLDAPVRRYLPDLDPGMDPRITVRQLLDHTSGLRDYFLDPRIDRALLGDRSATWDAARALGYAGASTATPGRVWRYSNTNYVVLGLLAERVTGRPLGDLYRTRFIEPLRLDDTVYQPDGPASGPVAHAYRLAGDAPGAASAAVDLSDGTRIVPFTSVITAAGAAGGMAASADDLARWGRALYTGQVLTASSLGEMLAGVARTEALAPRLPYGLGVQAIDILARPTLGHSGRLLGSRALLRHLPTEGITIALLTNQSRADPAPIARALLRTAILPIERCHCLAQD
ncbi:MAG: serine hydrolase domain-containing protein [Candidatus Limnocylindria bacterium]